MRKLLFPLLILFMSCASLPLVKSTDISTEQSSSKFMYDIDNNIAYRVEHDENYLYLHLKTDDKTAIQKIMMQGLFVYMDIKGGKSKNVYYNYPLKHERGQGMNRDMMKNIMKGQQGGGEREFDVSNFLDQLTMEAIFMDHDMAEKIPVWDNSGDFNVELSAANQNILLYDLKIPFDRLNENGLEGIEKLSLGIMTGKFEMPSMSEGRPGGGQSGGMQGGGMSGGGGQGGGRSGGGPGGMQGGGQGGGMDREAMTEQMSIWFEVQLSEETAQ